VNTYKQHSRLGGRPFQQKVITDWFHRSSIQAQGLFTTEQECQWRNSLPRQAYKQRCTHFAYTWHCTLKNVTKKWSWFLWRPFMLH